MLVRKKIVIFSPVGKFGGRELETGFIASVLGEKHDVKVISTGSYFKNSQVNIFKKNFIYTGLNKLILEKNNKVKLAIKIVSLFGRENSPNSLSGPKIKKTLKIESKKQQVIKNEIINSDLVFICAQISSSYLSDIINSSIQNRKPVLFRTTGRIDKLNYDTKTIENLNYVTKFIHHSFLNSKGLNMLKKHRFNIVDQCSYNERKLLKIATLNKQVKNYVTISRLVENKNIDIVIKAFNKVKEDGEKLFIVGDGNYIDELKGIAGNDVIFKGFISNNKIDEILTICECVIVSHYDLETGPLTGVEAMSSGKIIISAKTGAMPERLPFNSFWYNGDQEELEKQIINVRKLSINKVTSISRNVRTRYLEEYSCKSITDKYLNCVEAILN